ncbi:MAG: alkaline phosphatase D family protein [Sphingomonadales bacterium]|nr:alkaline phosphatase D family protein [Sphingomonadales bacterium]
MAKFRITRRDIIAGAAASAALPLASCEKPPKVAYDHGVASGDPLADRVILWTRAAPVVSPDEAPPAIVPVRWEVAEDDSFARIVAKGSAEASAAADYTVKVDAAGLQPGRGYAYRFRVGDQLSPAGATRTLPEGAVDSLSLAVVSCSSYPHGFYNVYRALSERDDIAAVIHLGDYIYEYDKDTYKSDQAIALGRVIEPEGELLTVDDYRARYGVYRRDPDLQAAHARHPFICVWDDHEIANDAWRDGAENHHEEDGDWVARRAAALQAYFEWLPIRAVPGEAGRIYRSFDFGDLARLVMLDTRLIGRDRQASYEALRAGMAPEDFRAQVLNDPARNMLGPAQEAWAAEALVGSKERGQPWQLIGQQIIFADHFSPTDLDIDLDAVPENVAQAIQNAAQLSKLGFPRSMDKWGAYPVARQRLLDVLAEHANNAVILTGDSHNAWAFEVGPDADPVAVELATPSVTSAGLEAYVPVDSATLEAAYMARNPNLKYFDAKRRGYLEVTATAESLTGRFHYVDTILDKAFTVTSDDAVVSMAGSHRVQLS